MYKLVIIITACAFFCINAIAKTPVICSNRYALCSAAACEPIPGIKNKVLCHCTVWNGKNAGYSSCQARKTKLTSTFSFGGFHYRNMHCEAGPAWADCLDQPCITNKNKPRYASCTCKLVSKKAFVTFAGECNSKACGKAIWSGATPEKNDIVIKALLAETPNKKDIDLQCKS